MRVCFLQFASLCRQTNCQRRKPLWVRVPQFPVCLTIFIFFSLCFVCLLSCSGYSTPFSRDVSMSKGLLCIVTFCRGRGLKKRKKIHPSRQQAFSALHFLFIHHPQDWETRSRYLASTTRDQNNTFPLSVRRSAHSHLSFWMGGWVGGKQRRGGGGTHLVAFHSPAQLSWPAPEKPAPVLRCVSDACANKTWLRLKLPVPSKYSGKKSSFFFLHRLRREQTRRPSLLLSLRGGSKRQTPEPWQPCALWRSFTRWSVSN